MLPKVGKKDKTSVHSWRPIALLSCVSKGLERIIARRIAWTALTNGILSSQHGGASVVDSFGSPFNCSFETLPVRSQFCSR